MIQLSLHRRPSLIAYITCGDPDLAATREIAVAAARAGADAIELGVPFSDPVADGPVIQRAIERALRAGTTLERVLQLACEVRLRAPRVALIVFSYLNPILRFGMERFAAQAAQAGLDGVLVTDLPIEESAQYLRLMRRHHLATVFLAAPTSTDERLRRICKASSGFVYAVSRTGITGAQNQLPQEAKELVARIRRFSKLPVAVGFGISTPAQVGEVGLFAEAAVVGSAIVEVIERATPLGKAPEAVAEFVGKLSAASRQPSAAAGSDHGRV